MSRKQYFRYYLFLLCTLSGALCCGVSAQSKAANEALFSAIRDADLKAVRALLSKGADTNAKDEDGLTPLMFAAMYAGADCMETLLAKGADPNAQSNTDVTALMLAIRQQEKIRLLLLSGADINARSKEGHTALSLSVGMGASEEVVRLLLDKGADLKVGNLLGAAARAGDVNIVKLLLAKGVDPNDSRNLIGAHFYTTKRASDLGKSNGAVLISPIPGVPGNSNNGGTPLMYAAHARNIEIIKLLIAGGADVKARHNGGGGALLPAAQMGDTGVVKLLLESGVDVNAQHSSGYTALMYAAAAENLDPELIRALLACGSDVHVIAKDGQTALTLARRKGSTEIVRLLEKAGANE